MVSCIPLSFPTPENVRYLGVTDAEEFGGYKKQNDRKTKKRPSGSMCFHIHYLELCSRISDSMWGGEEVNNAIKLNKLLSLNNNQGGDLSTGVYFFCYELFYSERARKPLAF